MTAVEIKAIMINRIHKNGLPLAVRKTWEHLEYGVVVNADGTLSKHPNGDYGPYEGKLEDLSLAELGLILEAQESVTHSFYVHTNII